MRSRIFQKIDPKMVGIFAPGARPPDDGASQFEAAEREMRRVSPDVFLEPAAGDPARPCGTAGASFRNKRSRTTRVLGLTTL